MSLATLFVMFTQNSIFSGWGKVLRHGGSGHCQIWQYEILRSSRGVRKATIIHVLGIRRYRLRKIWDDEVCRLTQQSGLVLCLGGFLFLPLTLKTLVFDSVHDILNIRPIHLTTHKVSTRRLQATRTTLHWYNFDSYSPSGEYNYVRS